MTRKLCYMYLTCDNSEKEAIARTLLDKHLVACAKFVPVDSLYWWQDKLERANETLIMLETAEDLFPEIEAEIEKIHSYETFVLTQVAMTKVSSKAQTWLEENLKPVPRPLKLS